MPALGGTTFCPSTLDPLIAQSSEALPVILKDQPLKTNVEANKEMDTLE